MDKNIRKLIDKIYKKRKRLVLKLSSRVKDKEKRATRAKKAKLKAITDRCILLLKERKEAKINEKQP
jgi:hypothetical protein